MLISVVNNKGGVGKTTCTVNIAHALSIKGKRVLVIDNDSQCNSTALLMSGQEPQHTLLNILSEGTPVARCIYPTTYGVDVLPNSQGTAMLELDMYHEVGQSYRLLHDRVRDYCVQNYDFVLIDCPPTLGMWVVMAMVASDAVMVPVEAGSRFSLDGLTSVINAVEEISARVNPKLRFLRALINKVDLRTSASKLIVETLRSRFPGRVFETTIPTNSAIQQAEIAHTTVFKHDPQSTGAKRFRLMADELIGVTDGKERR